MKFSLKDLLWSVTFASLGMGCLVKSEAGYWGRVHTEFDAALVMLSGGFLGAALGRFAGDTVAGVLFGLLLVLVWMATGQAIMS